MIKRGLDGNYSRGYRVLVDKTGLTKDLSPSASRHISQPLPTASEFHGAVNEFWFEAAHLPKYLLRDELWIVKFRDWTTKEALLKMLEWKVLLESDGATDIWYIGSHLREWIDSDTWTELQGVYSRFDRVDSWRGLIASMRLFRRISKEVAERAGFDYPQSTDDDITAYILSYEKRILDDSSREQFSS
jgi:aminoglycoside 6-adenylyltransferase